MMNKTFGKNAAITFIALIILVVLFFTIFQTTAFAAQTVDSNSNALSNLESSDISIDALADDGSEVDITINVKSAEENPGTPGIEPGVPGTEPGAPGTEPGVPGTEPATPGTEPSVPSTGDDSNIAMAVIIGSLALIIAAGAFFLLRKYNRNITKSMTALTLVFCLLITGTIIGTNSNYAYGADELTVSVPSASLVIDVTAGADKETMIKVPVTVDLPELKGYALTLSTQQNDIGSGDGTIREPEILSGLSVGYATDKNTTETNDNRIINGFDSAYTPYKDKEESNSKYAAFPEAGDADAKEIIKDSKTAGTNITNLYVAVRADDTAEAGTYHLKLNLVADTYDLTEPATGYTVKYDMNPNTDIVSASEANDAKAAAPTEETYESGEDVQLAYIPLVKNSAQITTPLWNTKADGTGDWYEGNDEITGGFDAPLGSTITLYAQWINGFKFTVDTTESPGATFSLPTRGIIANAPITQTWDIDWGDSEGIDDDANVSLDAERIQHEYAAAGTRQVTVWPSYYENELEDLELPNAGVDDATQIYQWFADFGNYGNFAGIDYLATLDSPLDIFMTRTKNQITDQDGDTPQPNNEWSDAFSYAGAKNNLFNMGSKFNLPQNITKVGDGFASDMFRVCSGNAFKMNTVFNLPQDISGSVGDAFAADMFLDCYGDAFNMNANFNLPQGIENVENWFANAMFYECSGDAFNMNTVFNLPQGISGSVGDGFADTMFYGCSGETFTMNSVFNLPQGIKKVGDGFATNMFAFCYRDAFKMNANFNLPQDIKEVGNNFVCNMFLYCYGNTFNMNTDFNLPQGISGNVGNDFVAGMFYGCYGNAFNMNTVFNLPQNISGSVGDVFVESMFYGCSGNAFNMNTVFNLPQGINSAGTYFASSMFEGCNGANFKVNDIFEFVSLAINQMYIDESPYYRMFYGTNDSIAPSQRSATSIANNAEIRIGDVLQNEPRNTFTLNWTDYVGLSDYFKNE
jgi:LPXTG-motif cell wall-anchored protein